MAIFTNQATLTYTGGSTDSNIVTGELLEVLSATKTALQPDYRPGDTVTYVVVIRNTGTAPISGLTLTDDLAAYAVGGTTVYPLTYVAGSVAAYANGVLQADPAVTTPNNNLVLSGLTVPAGGNLLLIYQANANAFAPLGADATLTNTATITGAGLTAPVTAAATIGTVDSPDLRIRKAVTPTTVTENGQLTYTLTVENYGPTAAVVTDDLSITDTFDPILNPITVTYNGAAWTATTNYTYNAATGLFTTVAGQITVPAATYTQNPNGTYTVTPGTAVITVTGTVQ